MSGLLKQLERAVTVVAAASEDVERPLLEELCQLCCADRALLLKPVATEHWQAVLCLPESAFAAASSNVEISWSIDRDAACQPTALEQLLSQRRAICSADPVRTGRYEYPHLRLLESEQGVQVAASLLLPLAGRDGRVEQVVELLRMADDSLGESFSADQQAAAAILIQQATSNQATGPVRNELSELLESLIQLIGSAIDEKSPFAGDHCRRVPVLTMMLARAVSVSKSPSFRDVQLSEAELYELEVAAWLHDIGKLITPINLTDKSAKLERTFDRFDLVRTRFEILRRDLEIAQLRAGARSDQVRLLAPGGDLAQMADDLQFVADCNRGHGSLTSQEMQRVAGISERYRWVDRLGSEMSVLTDDEVNNLMVVRGTLTDEEREMVNNHVMSTINMLDMLPFPDELAQVPEIAAAHHEYHDGRGFPSGLRGEQMLIQARILAFADRFESVSAGTRSYKKRNSLSRSLEIMREMVDEGQVAPDLYRLFVEERLYERYAIEFLSRDQVDPVAQTVLLEGLTG